MSVTCPNGHTSETSDYCDQCGAKIEGAAASVALPPDEPASAPPAGSPPVEAPVEAPAGAPAPEAPIPGEQLCPVCHSPRVGDDRFCEGCGHDFTAPPPVASVPGDVLAGSFGTPSPPAWEAVVTADRAYYDRIAPDGVTFPLHCPPRTFLLAGDQIRIGRRSTSRGIQPEVDLSGAPEDSAISHLHCLLLEQPDGSYTVVDPGSTNGTSLNDDPTPMLANVAVALADGDRLHLGAWTTITLHRRGATTVGP